MNHMRYKSSKELVVNGVSALLAMNARVSHYNKRANKINQEMQATVRRKHEANKLKANN